MVVHSDPFWDRNKKGAWFFDGMQKEPSAIVFFGFLFSQSSQRCRINHGRYPHGDISN
jgi:hypothetical protein